MAPLLTQAVNKASLMLGSPSMSSPPPVISAMILRSRIRCPSSIFAASELCNAVKSPSTRSAKSTPGRALGAASAESGRPGWPVARFFRGGSVMTRGQNRPRWELSADFDSENPARFLPPGRQSRGSDSTVPKLRQINLLGQPVTACAGPGSAPAPRPGARRRGIPHSHPTQELMAALSSQTRRTVLRQGLRRFQGRESCGGAPVANSVSSSNGADAKLTE